MATRTWPARGAGIITIIYRQWPCRATVPDGVGKAIADRLTGKQPDRRRIRRRSAPGRTAPGLESQRGQHRGHGAVVGAGVLVGGDGEIPRHTPGSREVVGAPVSYTHLRAHETKANLV